MNLLNDTEPAWDVRTIPGAIRHPAIIGGLLALPMEGSLLLQAPHLPTPLLNEVSALPDASFEFETLQDGPTQWIVRIRRTA